MPLVSHVARHQITRPLYRGRVCGYCRRPRVLRSGPWAGICDFCWHRYSWQQPWVSPAERHRMQEAYEARLRLPAAAARSAAGQVRASIER